MVQPLSFGALLLFSIFFTVTFFGGVNSSVIPRGDYNKRAATTTLKCNSDNVLRTLRNSKYRASASTFCSTYTKSSRTTQTLPYYVSQYPASRVSSACSCFITPTTTSRSSTITSTSKSTSSSKTSTLTSKSTSTLKTSTSTTTKTSTSSTKTTTTTSSKTTATSKSTTTTSKSSTSSTTSKTSTSTTKTTTSTSTTSSKSSTTTTSSTTTSTSTSSTTSSKSSTTSTSSTSTNCGAAEATPYWVDQVKHQGVAAFNSNSSHYPVYRNVKCYGAKGDGVTDDTAAINSAIAAGSRCASGCDSSTIQPAFIYFPGGTYIITAPIVALYYSQLVGNPNDVPVIKGRGDFSGIALIDSDPGYYTNQNNFFREIKNFVLDTTDIPATNYGTGIHWQVAQATNLQNIVFELSAVAGNIHQGIYMDNGSGGFMSDLTFRNGKFGAFFGNQQFTSRNMIFTGQSSTAIYTNYDWGWTFKNLQISNVPVGLDVSQGGPTNQAVSSAILLDSQMSGVGIAVRTARNSSTDTPIGAGSVIIENLAINNVPVVVGYTDGTTTQTILAGTTGSTVINDYGQGREYIPSTLPNGAYFQSKFTPARPRAQILLGSNGFVEKSKPQYANNVASDFVSVRTVGAVGDGITDDTQALQLAINEATAAGKIVFIDHGVYYVTSTITVPPGTRMIGEAWPRIMGGGAAFSSINSPAAVLAVGSSSSGFIEISNLVMQTKGPAGGAILIEWSLASSSNSDPSGLWDVHANVGGTAGTNLQFDKCAATMATVSTPDPNCVGAFLLMHVTTTATGLYMENNWLWTADHDLDYPGRGQITIYSGRGLFIESSGPTWLYGTAVEHNTLYNYEFYNADNIYAGMIQTETPYYQSNPSAPAPFTYNPVYGDPDFDTICANSATPGECRKSFGLRIVNSDNVLIYGSGLYSFFENYSTSCLSTLTCQLDMVSIENEKSSGKYVVLYNTNTIGTTNMIEEDGTVIAKGSDNVSTFPDTVAYYYTL